MYLLLNVFLGKQIAFWRFDATGAVAAYDAWIPNLQAYANFVAIGGSPYATSYPAIVQDYLISSLCQAAQQNCVGANQQYASQAACEAVLKAKNYGDYDEAWGDNVVCRTIHILLTKVRPEVCASLFHFFWLVVTTFVTAKRAVCFAWVNSMKCCWVHVLHYL